MRMIILVFISFFVFASCEESGVFRSKKDRTLQEKYNISGYVLNYGSNDISIIGVSRDTSSIYEFEVGRFDLDTNLYPTSFTTCSIKNEYYDYLAVAIAGEEINNENYGKVFKENNKSKLIFINKISGNIDYEIKLANIPYRVIEYENKIYVGQCREFNSSILIYQFSKEKNNFILKDSIILGKGLTDFILNYDGHKWIHRINALNSSEGSLSIIDLETNKIIKNINLGGFPIRINNNLPSEKYCVIDKINKKIHIIDEGEHDDLYEETVNVDFEPTDATIAIESYISLLVTNPSVGNLEKYNKYNVTWNKETPRFLGVGFDKLSRAAIINSKDNTILLWDRLDTVIIKVGNQPIDFTRVNYF